MKILFCFLLILFDHIGFGQHKHFNTINGPGKYCNVKIISESDDTIICILGDDCDFINFDKRKDVTWIVFSADTSTILEIKSFENGKQTKAHTQYFRNGQLKQQSYYLNGQVDGAFLTYNENGKIDWSGMYVDGRFIGTIYTYWDNGRVAEIRISTETSYYGQYCIYYDSEGNSISRLQFEQKWNRY